MSYPRRTPEDLLRLPGAVKFVCSRVERRPIPSDTAPERSLERRPRKYLNALAGSMGLRDAPMLGKDALVRTLGHALRDAGTVSEVLAYVGTCASRSFLADLVLQGRIRVDKLPAPVLAHFLVGPGVKYDWESAYCVLRSLSLLFLGTWDGVPALYVPDDVRRPYAQALLSQHTRELTGRVRRDLEALVLRSPPPQVPWAPGLPTPRARRRLPTQGPDRVLELEVSLSDLDPAVRRRILVSYRCSLGALHEIIRIAFAWPQRGRHWFFHEATGQTWAPRGRKIGDIEAHDEWKTPIRELLAARGSRASYVIDPPTHWVHEIKTLAIHAPSHIGAEPRVIAASGVRPPPEYPFVCSYGEFLELWRTGDIWSWEIELTSPDFDPDATIDLAALNDRLSGLH